MEELWPLLDGLRPSQESDVNPGDAVIPDEEVLQVVSYPEDRDEDGGNNLDQEVEELVQAARAQAQAPTRSANDPIGYASNARNAIATSDTFRFWAVAEETRLGIGSLVRHEATDPGTNRKTNTYAIVTKTGGSTLGLDDFAVHVYEADARPPLSSITPIPSRRRPVVDYEARMLASEQRAQRPILSGPVYDVTASLMAAVHNRKPIADQVATADAQPVAEQGATAETQDSTGPEPTVPIAVDNMWPEAGYMLLGFYEDRNGNFGAFAEDRTRVLGPRQGHVVLSGLPGAGKTSLFLTLVTSLYAQLRGLAQEGADE